MTTMAMASSGASVALVKIFSVPTTFCNAISSVVAPGKSSSIVFSVPCQVKLHPPVCF